MDSAEQQVRSIIKQIKRMFSTQGCENVCPESGTSYDFLQIFLKEVSGSA